MGQEPRRMTKDTQRTSSRAGVNIPPCVEDRD